MRNVYLMFLLLIATSFAQNLYSQEVECKSKISPEIGVVNRFVWRGIYLDSRPNIQPALKYENSGLTLGAWGSYNTTGEYAQTNFYIEYTKKVITFQLMDHYIDDTENDVNYFDYDSETTRHLYEGSVKLAFGSFSVLASSFLYGNDRDLDGDNRFSSYLELGYSRPVKDITLDFFLGASLNEGIYANSATVVNAGLKATKDIQITEKFAVPVSFSIVANPDKEKIFFLIEVKIK